MSNLLKEFGQTERLTKILMAVPSEYMARHYLHWDKLRYLKPPKGLTVQEWWLALKMQRFGQLRAIPLGTGWASISGSSSLILYSKSFTISTVGPVARCKCQNQLTIRRHETST